MLKVEISLVTSNAVYIDPDQFAYKEGHNSIMALIKCQHLWLRWLEKHAKYVQVIILISFDLMSKAFVRSL